MIRKATAEDTCAVIDMLNALTDMHVAEGLPDNRDALKRAVLGGLEHVFVAEEAGVPVGMVAWVPISTCEAVGYGTYVAPTHRRMGLSDSLRDAAKTYLRGMGVKVVTGGCALFNEPAMAAVRKQGFVPVAYVVQLNLED